ncbi:hypothetical protein BCR44DRAFT_1423371 [Catenaria anguillulae PL171]|uniref:Uncharacterized protein n=1 Tax=Catenaria anguillulae PL171 TaxID=765915 RepID=A0A1Y2I6M6_9FUNG|nr:hypothetical protein BCR44DRAFT_1423371 [Catenaria anguillulae PL171]
MVSLLAWRGHTTLFSDHPCRHSTGYLAILPEFLLPKCASTLLDWHSFLPSVPTIVSLWTGCFRQCLSTGCSPSTVHSCANSQIQGPSASSLLKSSPHWSQSGRESTTEWNRNKHPRTISLSPFSSMLIGDSSLTACSCSHTLCDRIRLYKCPRCCPT